MSFTTLNKFDVQGHPIKYDNYGTEAEAQARITELHAMGLTDAFYIDDDATSVNGERCFHNPKHWATDPIAKTVALDQASLDAEVREGHMATLRIERTRRLSESNNNVLADLWEVMAAPKRAEWTSYRQKLRDLPATVANPANPIWPVAPE